MRWRDWKVMNTRIQNNNKVLIWKLSENVCASDIKCKNIKTE